MAIGAPQSMTYTGTDITFAAVDAFQGIPAAERRFLWVKNSNASAVTVTIVIPGSTYEQANVDVAVSVPSGQERMIGPMSTAITDSSGNVVVFTSLQASVTAAVVDVPLPPPDLPS